MLKKIMQAFGVSSLNRLQCGAGIPTKYRW
jgi:hypothetical protein